MRTKHLLTKLIVAILFSSAIAFGQSHRNLPIYRNFNGVAPDSMNTLDSTSISYGGWSIQSPQGTRSWAVKNFTANYYVGCNGFISTGQVAQEQWFISPGFSTITYPNAHLNFSSANKFAGNPIAVLVSTNYDGVSLPSTATWSDITNLVTLPPPNPSGPRSWYKSGNVNLASFNGNNVYVGFKYTCDALTATDWEVDSISITNTITGIQTINSNGNIISFYPNPVNNELVVSNDLLIDKIEMYNLIGEQINSSQNINNKKYALNVSELRSGIYFAKVYLKNGTIVSQKIIKD